jgi:cysteinyl-tRNA synthetase
MREMKSLNILEPTYLPKATEHIAEQIALIQKLEAKGFTYSIDDGVYYDTSKFARYSEFARLDLEEQQAGARVEYNQQKRNPTDFALWKFTPEGQKRDMEWDSPWGRGFPGWHIECSAMSMKYLGETLDIHTGGIDHIQVHHTNEIAQSEPITGKPFANMWLHSNHVLIEGEKISKSLGNGIRLEDITAKGISLEAFRLHVLESHYRSQSKFSWESLEAAKNRLQDIYAWADLRYQTSADSMPDELDLLFKSTREDILSALQDDLNTPTALVALGKLMNYMSNIPIPGVEGKYTDGTLAFIESTLGLKVANRPDITDEQKSLIAEREQARDDKDWIKSDKLRNELAGQGIGLRDKPYGAQWYRL